MVNIINIIPIPIALHLIRVNEYYKHLSVYCITIQQFFFIAGLL